MLKLEDFKIKEIETLDSIKGGNIPCLDLTHHFVNFLGWIIETGTSGDIHPDQYLVRANSQLITSTANSYLQIEVILFKITINDKTFNCNSRQ